MISGAAHADHPSPGYPGNPYPGTDLRNAERLSNEAYQLDQQVRWSGLASVVRDTVSRFTLAAEQLLQCERQGGSYPYSGSYSDGYAEPLDHDPRPGNPYPGNPYPGNPYPGNPYPGNPGSRCNSQNQNVLSQFTQVERYLYDSQYNYPSVHSAYLRVRQAVDAIRSGNGGGYPTPVPPRQIRSTGLLDTIRYRFVGNSQFDIRQQCVQFGRSYGLHYVRGLVVNGQRFGGGVVGQYTLNQACDIVATHAQ